VSYDKLHDAGSVTQFIWALHQIVIEAQQQLRWLGEQPSPDSDNRRRITGRSHRAIGRSQLRPFHMTIVQTTADDSPEYITLVLASHLEHVENIESLKHSQETLRQQWNRLPRSPSSSSAL
jgi:hypothetical protein